jgi:hypothetical protein
MGLDQFMYVASKAATEFSEGIRHDLAYRRKHPSLHGFMKQLWISKGKPGTNYDDAEFNGIELELTWEDVDNLERAVRYSMLPSTQGFFFGNPADEVYFEQDLEFCVNAKAELFLGLKVFYNSSW